MSPARVKNGFIKPNILKRFPLLKSEIPIFMVCGDSDTVVPYKENGKILSDYFKENNGNLTEIVKAGCDHHPHGLEDYLPLFDFVKKYY